MTATVLSESSRDPPHRCPLKIKRGDSHERISILVNPTPSEMAPMSRHRGMPNTKLPLGSEWVSRFSPRGGRQDDR